MSCTDTGKGATLITVTEKLVPGHVTGPTFETVFTTFKAVSTVASIGTL